CRGVNNFPKRIYYTCNPGGVSHGYFKRIFIDRKYEEGENPEDYTFIQALVTDNKALMAAQPDYIKQLEALPPKLRDAWLFGRWDIFEGQFFEDFRETPDIDLCAKAGITPEEALRQRRFTHVIEPFEPPRGWNIMRSYDFGYNKPFSLGYWAIDYDGVLYRIMEMYGCTQTPDEGVKWSPDEQFKRISELERTHPWLKGRHIIDSVADPAIWNKSMGVSIADTAEEYGIYFTPGDNERIPGWMQVHYRFQFDKNGYPRMYFFNNCKAAIRTIPLMMYSETHPEDIDTKLEDHCPDEIRYMCMSRPVSPIVPEERKIILSDPLDQFKGRYNNYY
ncbi:MAG: Terminase-like family protein, partial [Clostridia bacterium]|nr:Terminase-like family protein [Clostridia bacterium]